MKHTFYTLLIAALSGFFALGLMASPAQAGALADWGKLKSPNSRFLLLEQTKDAVRDNETQLIWEKKPGDTNDDGVVDDTDRLIWGSPTDGGARRYCADKLVGGRKGWKLPSFDQLATLLDVNSPLCADPAQPCLPKNHPFKRVLPNNYWSATVNAEQPGNAWKVSFGDPFNPSNPDFNVFSTPKDDVAFVWCVRAGQTGSSSYGGSGGFRFVGESDVRFRRGGRESRTLDHARFRLRYTF